MTSNTACHNGPSDTACCQMEPLSKAASIKLKVNVIFLQSCFYSFFRKIHQHIKSREHTSPVFPRESANVNWQSSCLHLVQSCQKMAMLATKDFTAGKKITSSGTRSDDHWIKGLMLIFLFMQHFWIQMIHLESIEHDYTSRWQIQDFPRVGSPVLGEGGANIRSLASPLDPPMQGSKSIKLINTCQANSVWNGV